MAWRHLEGSAAIAGTDDEERTSNNNGLAARCQCGRRIRVAPSVLAAGPITCGLCGDDFEAPDPDATGQGDED